MKFKKGTKPTWNDVYDIKKYPGWLSPISEAVPFLKSIGYTMICFNDMIWELENDTMYITGWLRSDLDEKG